MRRLVKVFWRLPWFPAWYDSMGCATALCTYEKDQGVQKRWDELHRGLMREG